MKVPYLDLSLQMKALRPQVEKHFSDIMTSCQFVMSPGVERCEAALAEFVGAPYCVTAASGTDALLMALMAADVGPGDEVITTAFSFFATAETIALVGATPVFVDIEADTYNIDPQQIADKITSKTKAIMPVSLYGQMPDMLAINAIAKDHSLVVIEDAAQSFGATYEGKRSCNWSRFGCTSFFPAKPLGCYGDGGALFCQTEEDAQLLKEIRNHGQSSRYHHTRLGINGRLDSFQCAVLEVKIQRYPWEIEQRQKIATQYSEAFAGLPGVTIPVLRPGRDSVWAQYTLQVADREAWRQALQQRGVPTSIHYPSGMHQQPVMVEKYGSFPEMPVTDKAGQGVFSLPLYADMPADHTAYVAETVVSVAKSF